MHLQAGVGQSHTKGIGICRGVQQSRGRMACADCKDGSAVSDRKGVVADWAKKIFFLLECRPWNVVLSVHEEIKGI